MSWRPCIFLIGCSLTHQLQQESIQGFFWGGETSRITFQSEANVKETLTEYELLLKVEEVLVEYGLILKASVDNPFVAERLSVNDIPVISIQNGQGIVQDEDGTNQTKYMSNRLALESAGDYGNKPITSTLTNFIKQWKFYDFRQDTIRLYLENIGLSPLDKLKDSRPMPGMSDSGSTLSALLSYWYENDRKRFYSV